MPHFVRSPTRPIEALGSDLFAGDRQSIMSKPRLPEQKIIPDLERLCRILDDMRHQGKVVVTAGGCFELLHVGHIRYLTSARALGDTLVVMVNTDTSMRLIKPDRRPVNPDYERFELLAALEAVDYVVPLTDQTPARLLDRIRPDVHTKGTDYTLEQIPERVVVEAYGGRVAIVGDPKDHSTTDMLRELGTSPPASDDLQGDPPGDQG